MQILTNKTVKTRKKHYCHGCGTQYETGTPMRYISTVDDGVMSTAYWCEKCEEILSKLEPWQLEDGFAFGELAEMYSGKG